MTASGGAMEVRCPVKVNLYLRVLGRRADGFHDLESAVDLLEGEDVVRLEPGSGRKLTVEGDAPAGRENLVWRAWDAWQTCAGRGWEGHVVLRKRCPVGAGLGGGSGNAAAMLLALDRMAGIRVGGSCAAQVGSDVAVLLGDGPAWMTGRGERVDPLSAGPVREYVLVWPGIAVATPRVYAAWAGTLTPAEPLADPMSRGEWDVLLDRGELEPIARALRNDLEAPACRVAPVLSEVRRSLDRLAPGRVGMSGSGSAFFLLASSAGEADDLVRRVGHEFPSWRVWRSRSRGEGHRCR